MVITMTEFRMDGVIIYQKDEKEYGTITTKEHLATGVASQ